MNCSLFLGRSNSIAFQAASNLMLEAEKDNWFFREDLNAEDEIAPFSKALKSSACFAWLYSVSKLTAPIFLKAVAVLA